MQMLMLAPNSTIASTDQYVSRGTALDNRRKHILAKFHFLSAHLRSQHNESDPHWSATILNGSLADCVTKAFSVETGPAFNKHARDDMDVDPVLTGLSGDKQLCEEAGELRDTLLILLANR